MGCCPSGLCLDKSNNKLVDLTRRSAALLPRLLQASRVYLHFHRKYLSRILMVTLNELADFGGKYLLLRRKCYLVFVVSLNAWAIFEVTAPMRLCTPHWNVGLWGAGAGA